MPDQTTKNPRSAVRRVWSWCSAAAIPWLTASLAAGAILGASAGSLAWGLGVGAAVGLVLHQAYGKEEPARR